MNIKYIDREYIIGALAKDDFYVILPEFNFMLNYKDQMKKIANNEVGCSQCTENNVILPAIANFVSYLILRYNEQNEDFFNRLKSFTVHHYLHTDCELRFAFQQSENEEIKEIII
jgi:hypothetical protein